MLGRLEYPHHIEYFLDLQARDLPQLLGHTTVEGFLALHAAGLEIGAQPLEFHVCDVS